MSAPEEYEKTIAELREQLDAAVMRAERLDDFLSAAVEAGRNQRDRALAAESELEAVRKRTIEQCIGALGTGSDDHQQSALQAAADRIRSLPLTGSGEN